MIFKNVKNYFGAHPPSIGCTVHANAALALKSSARRRRAQVLKPANAPLTTNTSITTIAATHSVTLPSRLAPKKVHFSDAAHRRAKTCTSPVRVSLASASTSARSRSRTSVPLPARLERPVFREVDTEALTALDPKMKGVPADYVRDALESIGAKMLSVLASTVTTTPMVANTSSSSSLPKEVLVTVTVRDAEANVLPTHMLAVHSSTQPVTSAGARKVTLFPAHSLVLAAHCANLPVLPSSTSIPPPTPGSSSSADSSEDADADADANVQLTLPVLPLALPSPETFAPLSSYLYTRRADALLRTLLPLGASDSSSSSSSSSLANTPSSVLLSYALQIHGVWRNTCALGVHDERLWKVLDVAWTLVVGALAKSTAMGDAGVA